MKTRLLHSIKNGFLLGIIIILLSACSSPHSGNPRIDKYHNPKICDTCSDTEQQARHFNDRFYVPLVLPLKKGTVKELDLCSPIILKNVYAPNYQNNIHNGLILMGEFTHKWFGNPRLWTRTLKDFLAHELSTRNRTEDLRGNKLLQLAVTNIQLLWETRKIECRITTTVQTDETATFSFSESSTAIDLYSSCDKALAKSVTAILNSVEIRRYLLDVTPGCNEQFSTAIGPEEPLETEPIAVSTNHTTSPMLAVYFDYDSSSIRNDQKARMKINADFLKDKENVTIWLEGNCDSRGSREYNLALGERRALIAKQYLINMGITPDRISTVSFGEEKLLFYGDNEISHAKNRRSDFVIREQVMNDM